MQPGGTGQDASAADVETLSPVIADLSAGDLHQSNASREIPGRETPFPVTVETPRCDKGQIDRSSSACLLYTSDAADE